MQGAAEAGDSLLRSYTPDEFSRFTPRTALDLVNLLPGFKLVEEDSARGLGQASANVLINGARFTGKSSGIVDKLARTPASVVVRLEIHDGAALGIPGLSGDVANVIVKAQEVSGSWSWEAQHRDQNDEVDPAYWKFKLALSGEREGVSWNVGLDNDYQRLGHGGPERVFNAAGALQEFRDEYRTFDRDRPSITLGLTFNRPDGSVGNVDVRYEQYWQSDLELRNSDIAGDDQWFRYGENEQTIEYGGDYAFDVDGGRLKLIAYHMSERSPRRSLRLEGEDADELAEAAVIEGRSFTRSVNKLSETVLRSEYDWRAGVADWQVSVEAAYNTFDSRVKGALTGSFVGFGADVPIDIDEHVQELRFDGNASYSRPLAKRLHMQLSLGLENSELEQSGGASQQRNFTRAKGLVSLALKASERTTWGLRIERSVGQLAFADFIASVDLGDDNNNASNPDLVPSQSWLAELSLDQVIRDYGVVSLTLSYEDIEDIVDRIPVGGGGDAVGNLDSAKRYRAQLDTTINFDRWGWRGGRLEIDGELQRSELDDPVTGQQRRINDEIIHRLNAELRHDIPGTDWAWGIGYEAERRAPTFRIDRIDETTENRGLAFPFIEHKNVFGLTAKFRVRNFDDQTDTLVRQTFDGDRNGDLTGELVRDRDFGRIYILELRGGF